MNKLSFVKLDKETFMRAGNFRPTTAGEDHCCRTCIHMDHDDVNKLRVRYRALKCFLHNDIEISKAISENAPTSFVCDKWEEL